MKQPASYEWLISASVYRNDWYSIEVLGCAAAQTAGLTWRCNRLHCCTPARGTADAHAAASSPMWYWCAASRPIRLCIQVGRLLCTFLHRLPEAHTPVLHRDCLRQSNLELEVRSLAPSRGVQAYCKHCWGER